MGPIFYPLFFWHKIKDFHKKNHPWKYFAIPMCFDIFEFEVSAISLYGHRTTIYGISWKLWSQISQKLNMEWNFHSESNSSRSSDLNYKIHILPIWELPDYVPLRSGKTKVRISAHKFPIETGRFESKNELEKICLSCYNEIGDEIHYPLELRNIEIKSNSKEKNFFFNSELFKGT